MMTNRINLDALAESVKGHPLFQRVGREKLLFGYAEIVLALHELGLMRTPRFRIDDANKAAYENAAKWLAGDETMQVLNSITGQTEDANLQRGLYVGGETGSGKSWLLELLGILGAALFARVKVAGKDCSLAWSPLQSRTIISEYLAEGYDVIRRYGKQPILCIQDLGAEPYESLYMGNRVNVLAQILEIRGDRNDLLTLISSNMRMNGDALRDTYGERVQSRLKEMCNYLILSSVDRRGS